MKTTATALATMLLVGVAAAVPATAAEPLGGTFLVASVDTEVGSSIAAAVDTGAGIEPYAGELPDGARTGDATDRGLVPMSGAAPLERRGLTIAGNRTVDLVLLTVAGTSPTRSQSALETDLDSALAWWTRQSSGDITSFTRSSTTSLSTSASCASISANLFSFWEQIASSLGRSGGYYWGSSNRHLVVVTPSSCGAWFSGLGSVGDYGDGGAVLIPQDADVLVPGIAHELGHNLGLGHSNIDWCPVSGARTIPSGCTNYEYHDVYDVMGFGWSGYPAPALAMPRRYELGFFGPAEVPTITRTSAIATRTTLLVDAVTAASGVRGARIVDPYDPNAVYYVEYRNGTGDDAAAVYTEGWLNSGYPTGANSATAGRGVVVSRLVQGGAGDELNIFAMPTGSSVRELALDTGESFHTADQGVHVEVLAASGATAQLRITVGAWTGDTVPNVSRIAGADRYAVAVAISQATFGGTVGTVFLATGENFPDALSAGPLAAKLGGPVLLTPPSGIPPAVTNELQRLSPSRVVIVGGPASVPVAIEGQLRAVLGSGLDVDRLGGADRFAASRTIVSEGFLATGASTVYVSTGLNFPDALSAGAAGGSLGRPVILVNGAAAAVDAGTLALLSDLGTTTVLVAGGPNSVSNGVLASLQSAGYSVERISGVDRFEASANINAQAFPSGTLSDAYIATGLNFPDALAGSVLAAVKDAPLYVTPGSCVPTNTLGQLAARGVGKVTLFGGTASLTPAVAELMAC